MWSGAGSLPAIIGGCDTKKEVTFTDFYDFLDHMGDAEIFAAHEQFVRTIPMTINGDKRQVLFEHPPASIRFPQVPVHCNARLRFGVGISERAWDQGTDGALFEVVLTEGDGKEHPLYSRFLNPKDETDHRAWFDEEIDLTDFYGATVSITFKTSAGPSGNTTSDWAGWSEPHLAFEKTVRVKDPKHINVVLISIDTLRADYLGCAGYSGVISPAIDQLTKKGVLFSNAIAQATTTLPSHMSILTSLYPSVHAVSPSGRISEATVSLPEGRTTIAEVLKQNGYRTAAYVDGGWLNKKFGYDQGFDVYDDTAGHIKKINKKVMKFVKEHFQEKFFLFMHMYDVHGPYEPPHPYDRMFYQGNEYDPSNHSMDFIREVGYHDYQKFGDVTDIEFVKAQYAGCVRYVDSELAKLLHLLEELRIFNDTIIVLMSDHGESLFEHHVYVGHGMFLHETEVRIPLVMKLPKDKYAQTRVTDQVQSIDVMPTMLDLLNLSGPEEMQGRSLTKLIEQPKVRREETYAFGETPNLPGTAFVRTNRWKYISPLTISPENISETLQASDKINLAQYIVVGEQLYDLERDPDELNNIIDQEKDTAAALRERLEGWKSENRKQVTSFENEQRIRSKSGGVRLSEEERDNLKSLGYVE